MRSRAKWQRTQMCFAFPSSSADQTRWQSLLSRKQTIDGQKLSFMRNRTRPPRRAVLPFA